MKRIFLLLSQYILSISIVLGQAVFESSGSSIVWNSSSSWTLISGNDGDNIPDQDDDVTILNSHFITIDGLNVSAETLNLNNGSTLGVIAANGSLEIYGNLVNSGTIDAFGNFVINLTFASDGNISGTGGFSEKVNLIINNSVSTIVNFTGIDNTFLSITNDGTLTFNEDVEIQGNFVNTGAFSANSQTTTFTNSNFVQTLITSGGGTFSSIILDNSGGVQLQDALSLTGDFDNKTGFNANGQLVTFNGTNDQTVIASIPTAFESVTINTSGKVSIDNNFIIIGGDLTINSSSVLEIGDGHEVEAQGNVIIAGTLDGVGGTSSLRLTGTGTFDVSSGAIEANTEIIVDGGIITLGSNVDLLSSSRELKLESGSLDLNNNSITGNGNFEFNGGTLFIQDAAGIDDGGVTGQITTSNVTFGGDGLYVYNGGIPQDTGDGIAEANSGNINSAGGLTADNGTSLTISRPLDIDPNTSISIINGSSITEENTNFIDFTAGNPNVNITIDVNSSFITNSESASASDAVPRILNVSPVVTIDGTVELAATANNQYLPTGNTYNEVIFSGIGSNKFFENTTSTDITSLTIEDGVIADFGTTPINNSDEKGTTLTVNGSAQVTISRGVEPQPTFENFNVSTASTFIFAGSATTGSVKNDPTYGNITISSGTWSQSGDITVGGMNTTFQVNTGATYVLSSTENIDLEKNNLVIQSDGTLIFGDANGIQSDGMDGVIITTNNLDNVTIPADANYGFTGGVDMNVGDGFPNIVNNLIIASKDNTSTITVNNGGIEVDGILDLNENIDGPNDTRIISSVGNLLTVDLSSGSIDGGSATTYIVGPLQITNMNSIQPFPVGDFSDGIFDDYRPVTINPGMAGDFTVQHVTGTATGLGNDLGGTFESFLSSRFWNIQGSQNAEVSFQVEEVADNQGEPFILTALRVVTKPTSGIMWVDFGTPTTVSGSPTATITINIPNTNFPGDFTLASTEFTINPLPVELLSFSGKQIGSNIRLEWSTATEIDNEMFEIEHMVSEGEFNKIGQVPGNGDSDEVIEYKYVHNNPALGANFYRLKQIDFDGDFEYSDIIRVWFEQAGDFNFEVFPNPATEHMNVQFGKTIPANSVVEVLSLSGQSMMRQTIGSDRDEINLNVENLSNGIYILKVNTGNEVFRSRIIKE